jgi:hypothetical protein
MLTSRVRIAREDEWAQDRPIDRPRPGLGSGRRGETCEDDDHEDETTHRRLLVFDLDNNRCQR